MVRKILHACLVTLGNDLFNYRCRVTKMNALDKLTGLKYKQNNKGMKK